jgi:tetratricopeptide (TPR) repeat protein
MRIRVMKAVRFTRFQGQFALFLVVWTLLKVGVCAQTAGGPASNPGILVEMEAGEVQVQRAGSPVVEKPVKQAFVRPGDLLVTSARARGTLKWPKQQTARIGESTRLQVLAAVPRKLASVGILLLKGVLYYLQREPPEDMLFKSPSAAAAIRGTEFELRVTDNGVTILTLVDGEVELSTDQGRTNLTSGQQGVAFPGQAPFRTAALPVLNDVIQWCFYYPAILNVDELGLDANTLVPLEQSLAHYRRGDLLAALASYPQDRQPESAPERVYLAALFLSVGKIESAEALLSGPELSAGGAEQITRLAGALRSLIATVKLRPARPAGLIANTNALGSELMADSYYWQATAKLDQAENHLRRALSSAQAAAEQAPQFGYAWERLAEMQFSFGRTDAAFQALQRSFELAPRNAQAWALQGFLLAARRQFASALAAFDKAIEIDRGLGNAWLGRGLCLVHHGEVEAGREALLMAATVEPQRAILRSYLGKVYADMGDAGRATRELDLAKRFDPQDPTAWLYSALLNQQENRINEGIRDLEKSQELNENRSLYRSRLLLDQDRAVRSANLANLFRDDNMTDVSLREAARAVNADYVNYSSHLFLANTYDQLRDPNFVNLRLETAANSEYLIANLLAPVSGGILNQQISQQEYSRLFEQNHLGVVSSTEYLSRGAWIENGAQYGIFDTTSYSLAAFYRADRGQRPNNDVEQRQLDFQVKQQLSPKDTLYVDVSQLEMDAGDLRQYYNNTSPFPNLRTKEAQNPILTLGYHREWGPGQHTLVLASWLNDEYRYTNPSLQSLVNAAAPGGPQTFFGVPMGIDYRNQIEVFSIEPQQIWEQDGNLAIIGGRYQVGDVRFQNVQIAAMSPYAFLFGNPAASQDFTTHLEHFSIYAYDQYEVVRFLWLTAGIAYDRITFPDNLFAPPFSAQTTTEDQISPKAGLIWTAPSATTVRFAYSRSLTGATLEQSVRIEPTQVAGFNQTFRGLIPESVAGSIPGARIATYDVAVEQKLGSGTYLGISGQIADSDAKETIGAFLTQPPPRGTPPPAVPTTLIQTLDYGEKSVRFAADQLVGKQWSLGIRYQLTYASFTSVYPEIPDTAAEAALNPRTKAESLFHQVGLLATFNHPSGIFSQFEANWYSQSNHGYSGAQPGDAFWQLNLFAGYRFPHRRAEIRIGLLNLTDTDYHLAPLTFYSEFPRARTLTARFRFNF